MSSTDILRNGRAYVNFCDGFREAFPQLPSLLSLSLDLNFSLALNVCLYVVHWRANKAPIQYSSFSRSPYAMFVRDNVRVLLFQRLNG